MALVQATLETELLKLCDSTRPDFVGYPATPVDVGTAWATAYFNYAKAATDISLDGPLDPTMTVNQAAFASTLTANLPPGTPGGTIAQAAQAFESAFVAYWTASAFAVGTVPFPPGFVTEVSSLVTLITPSVLYGLLLTELAIMSSDVYTKVAAIATAFHTATTTAVIATITGTTLPPGPILLVATII